MNPTTSQRKQAARTYALMIADLFGIDRPDAAEAYDKLVDQIGPGELNVDSDGMTTIFFDGFSGTTERPADIVANGPTGFGDWVGLNDWEIVPCV